MFVSVANRNDRSISIIVSPREPVKAWLHSQSRWEAMYFGSQRRGVKATQSPVSPAVKNWERKAPI